MTPIYNYLSREIKDDLNERLRSDLSNNPQIAEFEIYKRNKVREFIIQFAQWRGVHSSSGYKWLSVGSVICDEHDVSFYIAENYKRLAPKNTYRPQNSSFRYIEKTKNIVYFDRISCNQQIHG